MTSIRDIAKMAGVSAASVSRILNNDDSFSINENTRQRVIETANKLNYSKDKNKRGVKSNSDDLTIALIVRHEEDSERNDPYFLDIRRGIEREASKWRIRVVQAFRMRDKEKDWNQLARYGAVIMIGEMTEEATKKVYDINHKLILVDSYSKYSKYDCIQTDFASKTHEVLDYLYHEGHRNIGFIGGLGSKVTIEGLSTYYKEEVRAVNYLEWMKLNNLEQFSKTFQGTWQAESGLNLGKQLLESKPRPTAVLVASDPMAVGVYKAINEANLRIPEDISVVSFDDIEMAEFMTPALSSIQMNAKEMGHLAVRMAKERMLEDRTMPIRTICSSELKMRDSIGALKK